MKIEQTAKIEITGLGTVSTLKELLNKIPDNAVTSISVLKGDRPYSDVNYLKFTWTEEF